MWALKNKSKKNLFEEIDFWRAERLWTRQRKDAGVTTVLERLENVMLKCYGHVTRMEVMVA
jgi:hypothetical protein